MKIWRRDDERVLPDCMQQMNKRDSGAGGISGSGTTAARSFEGTVNGMLYCDVLQHNQ